jgi:hypothetical protein
MKLVLLLVLLIFIVSIRPTHSIHGKAGTCWEGWNMRENTIGKKCTACWQGVRLTEKRTCKGQKYQCKRTWCKCRCRNTPKNPTPEELATAYCENDYETDDTCCAAPSRGLWSTELVRNDVKRCAGVWGPYWGPYCVNPGCGMTYPQCGPQCVPQCGTHCEGPYWGPVGPMWP